MSNKNHPKNVNKSADAQHKAANAGGTSTGAVNESAKDSGTITAEEAGEENKPASEVLENLGADLETVEGAQAAEGILTKHVADENTPQYDNLEWLESHNPIDYATDENKSSKFDAEREPKIQDGLEIIKTIKIAEIGINPLLVLISKWWEVKPARSAIKSMIDKEAKEKGFESDVYMQIELGAQVDAFSTMQTAIDRLRYAKTYFKPRKPLSTAVPTKPIQIDGVVYIVPIKEFEEAKLKFKDNRDELKAATIAFSKVKDETIEEL